MAHLGPERDVAVLAGLHGDREERNHKHKSDRARGQITKYKSVSVGRGRKSSRVHPEAPPPARPIRQEAAYDRPQRHGNAQHAGHDRQVLRSLLEGRDQGHDGERALDHAAGAERGDRAAQDEHGGRRRGRAERGAALEDDDAGQVHVAGAEVAVDVAEQRLRRGGDQQVRRAVPADVLQRSELGRDLGDGDGEDAGVEGEQQRAQHQRGQDGRQPRPGRVLRRRTRGLLGRRLGLRQCRDTVQVLFRLVVDVPEVGYSLAAQVLALPILALPVLASPELADSPLDVAGIVVPDRNAPGSL